MATTVSFSSQKGGVGKSILTMCLGTYIQHSGLKVCVIDSDYPQFSVDKKRTSELLELESDGAIREQYHRLELPDFKLYTSKVSELLRVVQLLKQEGKYDFIFVDLPGTLNLDEIENLAPLLDVIIVPMEPEMTVFISASESFKFYQKAAPSAKICALWNRIKKSEKPDFRLALGESIKKRGHIHMLDTIIYDTVGFKREASTLYPTDNPSIGTLLAELIQHKIL